MHQLGNSCLYYQVIKWDHKVFSLDWVYYIYVSYLDTYHIAAPKVYWSVTFRERVRNQYCQLMRVWDRSSNCNKKCKIICLPTIHLGVLSCSQLVETCRCIPDQIGIWKCWFLKRGENRRTQRKTSQSKRERTSNKLNPHGSDARIRTQATLVGGEWSPLPPK